MENGTNSTDEEEEFIYVPSFEFYLLLVVEILAMICNVAVFAYFIRFWQSLVVKAVRNHVIVVFITLSLIYLLLDLPFTINQYRIGFDQIRKRGFCLWWYWLDYTLIIACVCLTAVASVQRHILIFNLHWLQSVRLRRLLHYLPILLSLLYPAIFYSVAILFYPCGDPDEASSGYCPSPCYYQNAFLFNYDWIANTATPLTVSLISNIALVFRVTRSMRKTRQRQSSTWKRNRKLMLQLLALSSLYVFGWMPSTLMSIIESFRFPGLLEEYPQLEYLNFLTYFVCPLQPFLCLWSLPELIKSVKNQCHRVIHRQEVVPIRALPTNT